jgi:hypothetical protein
MSLSNEEINEFIHNKGNVDVVKSLFKDTDNYTREVSYFKNAFFIFIYFLIRSVIFFCLS